jgi:hypothetical protein
VRLDDDVQPARTHEAVGAWECQAELVHDFGDADGRGTGDTHATVDQSGGTIAAAAFWRMEWSVVLQQPKTQDVTHQ